MNKAQEIHFKIMELASFNAFDGKTVVRSLKANKDLWTGAVFGRFDGYAELIVLRDISEGYYNADTLYLLVPNGKEKDIVLLAHTWHADEIDFIKNDEAAKLLGTTHPDGSLLRVRWE